ncbi:MAG: DUF4870 domain-containing protein [Dehalococcoidales bacterium]
MEKTSTGLQENVAALLCYVALWATGLIFILLETENKFVRYHAMQSIIVFGSLSVVTIIMTPIPIIGLGIASVAGLLAIVLWIVLMVKAYQGEKFMLPVVGELAEKWSTSTKKK